MRVLSLILLVITTSMATEQASALQVDGNYHPLHSEFEFLVDRGGALTLDDILSQPEQYPFTASRDRTPDATFDAVWLKLTLNFSAEALSRKYILFGRVGNLYDIRLYRPDEQGVYREKVTGEDYPVSSREIDSLRYGFDITSSAEPTTLYIRFVGGPGTSKLPWDLVEEETYLKNTQVYYSLNVAALSGIGALLCFNLVIALSLRRKDYLYYSAYVLSVMLGLITLDGIGFYYLWPDTPVLNERAQHSFNLISSGTRLLAILYFLDIARLAPRWHLTARAILLLLAGTFIAVNAVGITNLSPYAATVPWAIAILFGFAVCAYAITLQVKLALPLLITLLIPSIAAVIQALLTVNSDQISVLELEMAKLGFAVHVMLFSLCLAAQIKIQAESHNIALHDSLTGLPGTSLLRERFEWTANLSQKQDWGMAVLFIDLDGFKAVNDSLGHAVGDQVLIQAAARMQGVLDRLDFVARLGGDEFIVLLGDVDDDDAAIMGADKLLLALSATYRIDSREARISASIGIARFPDQGRDLAALIKLADSAMYGAKAKGKNSYCLASECFPATAPAPVNATNGVYKISQARSR